MFRWTLSTCSIQPGPPRMTGRLQSRSRRRRTPVKARDTGDFGQSFTPSNVAPRWDNRTSLNSLFGWVNNGAALINNEFLAARSTTHVLTRPTSGEQNEEARRLLAATSLYVLVHCSLARCFCCLYAAPVESFAVTKSAHWLCSNANLLSTFNPLSCFHIV